MQSLVSAIGIVVYSATFDGPSPFCALLIIKENTVVLLLCQSYISGVSLFLFPLAW